MERRCALFVTKKFQAYQVISEDFIQMNQAASMERRSAPFVAKWFQTYPVITGHMFMNVKIKRPIKRKRRSALFVAKWFQTYPVITGDIILLNHQHQNNINVNFVIRSTDKLHLSSAIYSRSMRTITTMNVSFVIKSTNRNYF